MKKDDEGSGPGLESWAPFRFSVVGPLLTCPPRHGELQTELEQLSQKLWLHPVTGEKVGFAFSTIETWYYRARAKNDPVGVLRRKARKDGGTHPSMTEKMGKALEGLYTSHPRWSYKLHHDNLQALAQESPDLGKAPSYPSLRRFMQDRGWIPRKGPRTGDLTDGQKRALHHRDTREVRSFEAEHAGALWHLDFHHGSLKVLTSQGAWVRPVLLAILDDHSRLVCHMQWYLHETAENLVHGLSQAFLKRGLPRSLAHDNGSPMLAQETTQGLLRLSVLAQRTLPYSPYQNGKQEVLWAQVEGRLLSMLEGQPNLDLRLLNNATQAWVEMDYHHNVHSETKQTPLARLVEGPSVFRPAPTLDELRQAFTIQCSRSQRRSDGTFSLQGRRFEVPSRFRHFKKLVLRYASWDLSFVWLVDPRQGTLLCRLYPLDKAKNAEGFRRPLDPPPSVPDPSSSAPGIAPLLRQQMVDYAATGLPPAYIPTEESSS